MSAHASALTTLRSWSAPSAAQEALRARFVDHLEQRTDGLRRTCAPGHLTAGALVLSPGLDAVLLNLHGRARRWFHFGGHWEPSDASLLATAVREATEESGLAELRVHPVPVHLDHHRVEFCRGHERVDHLDVRYAAVPVAGVEPTASEESVEVRWWPVDALPDLEPGMHELIDLSRRRIAQWRRLGQSPRSGTHRHPPAARRLGEVPTARSRG